jgi:hypothetical protein
MGEVAFARAKIYSAVEEEDLARFAYAGLVNLSHCSTLSCSKINALK